MASCALLLAILAIAASSLSTVKSECTDSAGHCKSNAKYCYHPPNWNSYMKKFCKKTCTKHCDEGTGGGGHGQCGKSDVQQSRIIAGKDAKKGAWPWLVSLGYRGRTTHFCGASLIAAKWVITASHCLRKTDPSKLKIIVGEHDRNVDEGTEQFIYVKRIIRHPKFGTSGLDNDIALLELEKPAQFTKSVKPVCLPKQGEKPTEGTKCFLVGWGSIKFPSPPHHLLQQAVLPIVNHRRCSIWNGILCAGYGYSSKINACQGDSGGPLVCQRSDGSWVQHGVTSYVVEYCKRYTGFANVGSYVDWIRKETGM